jgi:hypothetical protein
MPARGTCASLLRPFSGIVLPGRFSGQGSVQYCADAAFEYDPFARAALESMRSSYHAMPTADVREFGMFFSQGNFTWLKEQVKQRSGYYMDDAELMDNMMAAYTMMPPRSDPVDLQRRTDFSVETSRSYVRDINKLVLERTVELTKQANKQWDWYAKNLNGPSELPEQEIDTRTRLNASMYDMNWQMPDD